ncbi:MAG: hypothetical protein SGPRY_002954, partial [Prymnesium sp.]
MSSRALLAGLLSLPALWAVLAWSRALRSRAAGSRLARQKAAPRPSSPTPPPPASIEDPSLIEPHASVAQPTKAACDKLSEASLDPRGDHAWDELRESAHSLLDASLDHLVSCSHGRVWTPAPESLRSGLLSPLPRDPSPLSSVCKQMRSFLPYGVGNTHPRFFGWVHGSGTPAGLLPELVAAAINANCGGRDHIGIHLERAVLGWARELAGFPAGCGALLTSGTSMATVIAIKAARDQRMGFEACREGGVCYAGGGGGGGGEGGCRGGGVEGRLLGYIAEGGHSCAKRAFDLLGLGSSQLRAVPLTPDFGMDLLALRSLVTADRQAGGMPFALLGTAGSVNVGAIDPLNLLADFAEEQDLWFHVDGAIGCAALLSDVARPLLSGLSRANSLAFDFHKWLHVNYDCGCVLVRDADTQLRSFSERPDYLAPNARGLAAGSPWPVDYGPELSRGCRALKVWSHLKVHGTRRLGDAITTNLLHARHLANLVDSQPRLERLAPVKLQIVVFRYCGSTGSGLDAINDAIVVQLQEQGTAAPSTTRISGKLAIRVNITNHRTRFEDLDFLIDEVLRIG